MKDSLTILFGLIAWFLSQWREASRPSCAIGGCILLLVAGSVMIVAGCGGSDTTVPDNNDSAPTISIAHRATESTAERSKAAEDNTPAVELFAPTAKPTVTSTVRPSATATVISPSVPTSTPTWTATITNSPAVEVTEVPSPTSSVPVLILIPTPTTDLEKTLAETPIPTDTPTPTSTATPTHTHTSTPSPTSRPVARTNSNGNLRSGPGTEFPIVGGVSAGEELDLTGMSITGEWYLTAGDTWIAAFLVDDAPGDLPIVVAVTQEPEVAPSSPTPPATVSRIADFPSLLGSDLSTVETVLGRPQDVIPLYPGDMLRYSGSGYAGNYYFGDYFIYGFYDARDVLRGIQIYAGLSDMGFTIDEWHKVLSLVGLPASVRPDEEYLITRRWNNLSVYFVEINSLGPDPSSPIWGIMVWINE